MKQQLLITLACLSLAMAACSDKDSYRSGKGGSSGGGGGGADNNPSSEQIALEMVAKDNTFTQLSESEESQELKAGTQGVQVKVLPLVHPVQGSPVVEGMLSMQIAVLDRNSENCTPRDITVPSFREADLISGQVKVEGVGRVVCIDTNECNDVLLYIESRGEQFTDGNLRQNVVTAITSVRLSKDENGVFRPAQNESDVFANPQTIEQSIAQCLAQRQSAGAGAGAPATGAAAPVVESEQARLQQLTSEIQNIEAQIRNNAPTVNNEMRARLAALKSQRSDLIRQRQTRAYKAAQTAPTVAVDAEQARLQQLTREIQNIEAQIRNNSPTVNNEMRARLTALKSERSDLIRQRQTRAYKAAQTGGTAGQTVVDPLAGFEEPDAGQPVEDRR